MNQFSHMQKKRRKCIRKKTSLWHSVARLCAKLLVCFVRLVGAKLRVSKLILANDFIRILVQTYSFISNCMCTAMWYLYWAPKIPKNGSIYWYRPASQKLITGDRWRLEECNSVLFRLIFKSKTSLERSVHNLNVDTLFNRTRYSFTAATRSRLGNSSKLRCFLMVDRSRFWCIAHSFERLP